MEAYPILHGAEQVATPLNEDPYPVLNSSNGQALDKDTSDRSTISIRGNQQENDLDVADEAVITTDSTLDVGDINNDIILYPKTKCSHCKWHGIFDGCK